MAKSPSGGHPPSHPGSINDQFTRQAELFANAPVLHDSAALAALIEAAAPQPTVTSLDVACGPGTVVAAFARHVRHAHGLDATAAMLDQARKLATRQGIENASWHRGDVYALSFETASFDIVTCRFAFHHFEHPGQAFAEMVRVCRPGGRVVLCDAVVSDDPAKAAAFNTMERMRDPSTVEFRTPTYLHGLFGAAGLPAPARTNYQVPIELEAMLRVSFPVGEDRDGVRALFRNGIAGDKMGVHARADDGKIRFEYAAVIFTSSKP